MADSMFTRDRRASPRGGQRRNNVWSSMERFWQSSYFPDYLGLVLLLAVYMLILAFVVPFHRMFSTDDLAISFPHAEHERVPPGMLFLYAGGVPLAFLAIWFIIFRAPFHKVHVTYLGLFTSVFVTIFLTDVIKNAVGRPRPDLLARCKPPGPPTHALVGISICTETSHHLLQDGWRSFPSGHSSFSFAGLGYISLFVTAQLHALKPGTPLPFTLLAVAPLLGALVIAISRCEDYRHDVWDVTAGSVLGFLVALGSYRRVYPSLWHPGAEVPFVSRAEAWRNRAKERKPGDEEGRVGNGSGGGAAAAGGEESDDEMERGLLNANGRGR